MRRSITEYGAVPGTGAKCTEQIQRAIDECARAGGGTVVIPAGVFVSGSVRLRSGVELHLEHGAMLRASHDENDMIDFSRDIEDDNEDTGWEGGCFLYACHEKDIAITGTGVIDGGGRESFYDDDPEEAPHEGPLNVRGFRPRMSFLEDVENLTVTDVTFYDSAFWTLHMAGCTNVRIENICIDNDRRAPNTDGIDPDCCKNVIIRGCRIKSGDDCIVIKTTGPMYRKYGESRDILVSGCILTTSCTAVKIGTETCGDIHNVLVSDCIVRDCLRGIGIWSRDGGDIYAVRVHHVQGNTRNFADCAVRREGIFSWWGEGEPVFLSTARRADSPRIPGRIFDITMDHLDFISESPIVIAGEEYSVIRKVRITDSRFVFRRQSGKRELVMDERPSVRGRYLMASGPVYLRCAEDVIVDAETVICGSMAELMTDTAPDTCFQQTESR